MSTALVQARKRQAEATKARATKTLAAMIRAREPITFAAVAARAGVSREYLYRTPDLAQRIRATRLTTRPALVLDTARSDPVVAALRDHIRRMETKHAAEVRALRDENVTLRQQFQRALGQLVTP